MDRSLYRRINDLADSTTWAHGLVRGYAKYGIVVLGVLLLVAWWQARRSDDAPAAVAMVVWAAAAPLGALAVAQLLNHLVDRSRPYAAMPSAHVLIARSADASFPSDHATAAGAVAAGLLIAGGTIGNPPRRPHRRGRRDPAGLRPPLCRRALPHRCSRRARTRRHHCARTRPSRSAPAHPVARWS